MWEIRRYDPRQREEWNAFIEKARNSTFLFSRHYMDYHADRFSDHSLMAYRKGKLMAVLPANRSGNILYSHQGLTYGGWVWAHAGLDATDIFHLWRLWMECCKAEGITKIVYKPLPYIYSEMPSGEDLYMLFLTGAGIVSTDISSAIDLDSNPGFDKLQRRHLKSAISEFEVATISADDGEGVGEFHRLLCRCLEERHGCAPVHSLEELRLLMDSFPEEILIWAAINGSEEIEAAICVYNTGMCAHCQYIATSPEGRERNALSVVVDAMIEYYGDTGTRYFDFGISNEEGGKLLNPGLNRQKTSYGGSGVAYQKYEINVASALAVLPNELWPGR